MTTHKRKPQAAAKENAQEQEEQLRPSDGEDVEALREERAEILEDLRADDAEDTKEVQAEADEAGLHEAKLDDAGAAAQQKSARDNNLDKMNRLGELTGAPVVAPVLEESAASIKVVSRREGEEFDDGVDYAEVGKARFVGFNLHIVGEDFPAPGEVIIDIRRANGQDHQRYSAWTEDGRLDTVLPGINGIGDWEVHCESLVTQVGEGREDHLPLIKETGVVHLELY